MTFEKEDRDKIDRIDKQINELVLIQKETRKASWFPMFNSDLASIDSQIADLKHQRDTLYSIVKQATAPATTTSKDFSKSPLYSKTLDSLNFEYKDQISLYLTILGATTTASFFIFRASRRQFYLSKAHEAIKMKNVDDIGVFVHRAGLSSPEQVEGAMRSNVRLFGPLFPAFAVVGGFVSWVQLKNRNRFSK